MNNIERKRVRNASIRYGKTRSQKGSIVQSALCVQKQWGKVVQDQKAVRNMYLCVHVQETDDCKRHAEEERNLNFRGFFLVTNFSFPLPTMNFCMCFTGLLSPKTQTWVLTPHIAVYDPFLIDAGHKTCRGCRCLLSVNHCFFVYFNLFFFNVPGCRDSSLKI